MRLPVMVRLPLMAGVAFLNAHAIATLVGAELAPDALELAEGSVVSDQAVACPAPRAPNARPILERNPFDHEAGALVPPTPMVAGRRAKHSGDTVAAADPGKAASDAEPAPGIRVKSGGEFTIDRGLVDKVLQDQSTLMRQARAVPVREDGRIVGVRLSGIRSDGLLGMLGIQNGDEVRSINGYEVGTPDKALEAYAHLANAKRLSVQLRRGGATLHLGYTID